MHPAEIAVRKLLEQICEIRFGPDYLGDNFEVSSAVDAKRVLGMAATVYSLLTKEAFVTLLKEEYGTENIDLIDPEDAREKLICILSNMPKNDEEFLEGFNILEHALREYQDGKNPRLFVRDDDGSHIYRKHECRLKILEFMYFYKGQGETLESIRARIATVLGTTKERLEEWTDRKTIEREKFFGADRTKEEINEITRKATEDGKFYSEYHDPSNTKYTRNGHRTFEGHDVFEYAEYIANKYSVSEFEKIVQLYRAFRADENS